MSKEIETESKQDIWCPLLDTPAPLRKTATLTSNFRDLQLKFLNIYIYISDIYKAGNLHFCHSLRQSDPVTVGHARLLGCCLRRMVPQQEHGLSRPTQLTPPFVSVGFLVEALATSAFLHLLVPISVFVILTTWAFCIKWYY